MLTHPQALFGLSDAGAHVATIVDGTFPTTTLALWGRGSGGRDSRPIPLEASRLRETRRRDIRRRRVAYVDRLIDVLKSGPGAS
jgi:N-acyl-D-aspartate/D-glutamate deacylase